MGIDRTKCIGASDVKDVFSLPPYGCRRRLWYEKSGQPVDYPKTETEHIRRGLLFEDFIATLYQRETKNRLVKLSGKNLPLRDSDHPFITAQPDRLLKKDGAPFEAKCPGRRTFIKVKADGLQDEYILQVQQQIHITKTDYGVVAILCAETGDFLHFEQAREQGLIQEILRAEISFWQEVQDKKSPERLDVSDTRCRRCEYRICCRGQALLDSVPAGDGELQTDTSLFGILGQYAEAKSIYEDAEAYLEEIKEKIRQALGGRMAVEVPGQGRVYYKPVESMRWDTKLLAARHPELTTEFRKKIITRPLNIHLF